MDPAQTFDQTFDPYSRKMYDDNRKSLIRSVVHGRSYDFRQYNGHEFDSFELPPEFESFEALRSVHESGMGVRQQEIGWRFNSMDELLVRFRRYQDEREMGVRQREIGLSFNSMDELLVRLRRYQEELPFDPSNTEPGEFWIGILFFYYFMHFADDDRRGQHNETRESVRRYFNPMADFWTDLARWNQFMLVPQAHDHEMPPKALVARLPVVDTATLAEEDRSCPICTDRYTDTVVSPSTTAASGNAKDPEVEPAVQLPCLHVLGRNCLMALLKTGYRTCPSCRANVQDDTATNKNKQ